MKSFILKTAVFLVILLALINLLQRYAICSYLGNANYYAKRQEVAASTIPFNTFLFGSSRIYRQIKPGLFDALTENLTTTYNMATPGTNPPESYYLVEKFLQNPPSDPGYLIVELQGLDTVPDANLHTSKVKYFLTLPEYLFALRTTWQSDTFDFLTKLSLFKNYTLNYLEKLTGIGLLGECGRLVLGMSSLTGTLSQVEHRGHISLDEQVAQLAAAELTTRQNEFLANPRPLNVRKRQAEEVYTAAQLPDYSTAHLNRLNKMIETAAAKGYYLIYVLPPRLTQQHYEELLPIARRLDPNHLIDLGNPQAYPEFYKVENSFDIGHLNEKGLRLFTNAVALNFMEIIEHQK